LYAISDSWKSSEIEVEEDYLKPKQTICSGLGRRPENVPGKGSFYIVIREGKSLNLLEEILN
jgi:hypothetical protein